MAVHVNEIEAEQPERSWSPVWEWDRERAYHEWNPWAAELDGYRPRPRPWDPAGGPDLDPAEGRTLEDRAGVMSLDAVLDMMSGLIQARPISPYAGQY